MKSCYDCKNYPICSVPVIIENAFDKNYLSMHNQYITKTLGTMMELYATLYEGVGDKCKSFEKNPGGQ